MTTAEALEALTDRSRFELLATGVLRKAEPKYAGIIHTGVNARGETIVAPIDGLYLIPHSNPPHYVLVQHTTTNRERLRGKWLSNADADLPKAIAEIDKVRRDRPTAKFTVVLTSNQRVDQQLVTDVYDAGHSRDFAVDIWEQSRIAGFLDGDADGHWLRKEYLGIEAERLSADLLRQLGRKSIELYREEIRLPERGPIVSRVQVDEIVASSAPSGPRLCLVVGRSGFGKSVAALEALERCLCSGSLALWVPARVLEGTISLESALENYLRSLHPALQAGAGGVAIELAESADQLILCLDDINRSPQAERLLRLAVNLAVPASDRAEQSRQGNVLPSAASLCLIVPVWPEQLSSVPETTLNSRSVKVVTVGELLPDECLEIIRLRMPRLARHEAIEYAARLNQDPFLVGLFAGMLEETMTDAQIRAVAEDALGKFLARQFNDVCSTGPADLMSFELTNVLDSVAREMLVRRNLRPSLDEVESWFGEQSKEIRGLRMLCRQGHVCRLDDRERRLEFRHDRLQEHFLAAAMRGLLLFPDVPEAVVTDPYYSVIVGKVLSRTAVSPELLRVLRNKAPFAIFEAVRELGQPSDDYQERLCQEARGWAAEASGNAPESMLSAICWTLMETDSSRALGIVEAFRPNRLLMAAGFRNGSAEHGMRFVRGNVRHGFEPGVTHAVRDKLIDQAGRRHGADFARQIRDRLSEQELPVDDVNSYLALVGHLQLGGFDDLIEQAWARHQDEVLEYAIWATCRCPTRDAAPLLRPLIDRLRSMPVYDGHTTGRVEREFLSKQLGWGFRRGIAREAVKVLVNAAGDDAALQRDVERMLAGADDPDAVEFLVRHSGSWEWRSIGDNDPQTRLASEATNQRLLNLWQSSNESNEVRANAFCLWLQISDCRDASVLRSIGPDSPFYWYAVQHRIKLGDLSIAGELVSLLRSNDIGSFWLTLAHRVWCDDLRSFVSERLQALDGTIPSDFSGGRYDELHFFAELLVKAPVADAQSLLESNWAHLQYSPLMIQAALRIGTPNCVRLASEAIAKCPGDIDVFDLAFSTVWEQKNPSNPITLRHLLDLEPFLHRITEHELLFLAWRLEWSIADDERIDEWIRKHVVPRLPHDDRRRVDVADEMLLDYLDRGYEQHEYVPHLDIFFKRQQRRRIHSAERQLRVVDEWLSNHRTVRGLLLAAECLKILGSRRDLALVDRYPIDGDVAKIARIKADASFSVCRRTLA